MDRIVTVSYDYARDRRGSGMICEDLLKARERAATERVERLLAGCPKKLISRPYTSECTTGYLVTGFGWESPRRLEAAKSWLGGRLSRIRFSIGLLRRIFMQT